jgi:4'-phosphopantetheinyl transferase
MPAPAMPALALPDRLVAGDIHVLRLRVDAPPIPIETLAGIASDAERDRAAAFRQVADAHRHLLGRGILRVALARLLSVSPTSLRLQQTPAGKPFLEGGPVFNIAHSGNVVLIAITDTGRLGVDVEAIRPLGDLTGLARTTFDRDELDALARTPAADQQDTFYRIWTRKEAILKAIGEGLSALRSVSVSAEREVPNALRRLDREHEVVTEWTVRSLPSSPSTAAAIAIDRVVHRVSIAEY